MSKKVSILGVKIDKINMDEALSKASSAMKRGKPCRVFTPNPEIIMMAKKDDGFLDILNNADMLLPDGIGVVIASKLKKQPLKTRVAGYDFLVRMIEIIEKEGKGIFLFGAKPGVAESAKEQLELKFPTLNVCGTHSGYFEESESDKIIEEINVSNADALVVCLGAPAQERWISKHSEALKPTVIIGAGGALDVLSGYVKRAPKYIQKIGLEWLYRALCNPQRIPRLIALPRFLIAVLMNKR